MSNHLKSSLLAATTLIAFTATSANAAGVIFPGADIQVAGATTVQDVLPREANCISSTKFTFNAASGATVTSNSFTVNADKVVSARALGNFDAFSGALPFDCATSDIQPNLTLHYLGTGSGTGRNLLAASNFQTTYGAITYTPSGGSATFIGNPSAAVYGVDVANWNGLHAAFSDSPAAAPFSAFTTAKPDAKAFIQVPMYVVPIAVAYSPIYAQHKVTGNTLAFNIAKPVTVGTTTIGGLRLTKTAYCGIFNGYIKNWNDPLIAAANYSALYTKKDVLPVGKKVGDPNIIPLFDPTFDNATRWAAEGAPVRLVGRLDKSGTTSIFTRHLAAVCGSALPVGKANLYQKENEILPYASATLDLTSFRFDSPYKPGNNGAGTTAGDTNLISGIVYTGEGNLANQGFITNGTAGSTAEATTPTAGTSIDGNGLFLLASGGGNVRSAIASFSKDTTGSVYTVGNLRFNGKIGYVSADNVLPAATTGNLNSAALEVGETFAIAKEAKKLFALPNAATATAAFGDVLPPQTDKKGVFTLKGTKKADLVTVFSRANSDDWYQILYANTKINKKGGLADPQVGYALTGTTQLDTGTCFASPATRNAMVAMFTTILGINTTDKSGNALSANLFTGVTSPEVGIRAQAGLAPLPLAWRTAINNTFFKYDLKTVAGLSTKGTPAKGTTPAIPATDVVLFIQNGLPTTQGKADALPTVAVGTRDAKKLTYTGFGEAEPNPSCTAAAGL